MRLGEAVSCATIAISCSAIARAEQPPSTDEPRLPPPREARPPEPTLPPPRPLAWQQHVEVGGGLAFVEMPASVDGAKNPTGVRFTPHYGFHVDLTWPIFRYLRFTGYLVEHDNPLDLPRGSLGLMGTIAASSVHAYSFGVRFSPTLPIGPRVRLWLTAGAGWGRLEYGRFTITDPGQSASFT